MLRFKMFNAHEYRLWWRWALALTSLHFFLYLITGSTFMANPISLSGFITSTSSTANLWDLIVSPIFVASVLFLSPTRLGIWNDYRVFGWLWCSLCFMTGLQTGTVLGILSAVFVFMFSVFLYGIFLLALKLSDFFSTKIPAVIVLLNKAIDFMFDR